MNETEVLKRAAILRAVNEGRIYPFHKRAFALGFLEGRNSAEEELERHQAILEMRLDKETLLRHLHIEDGAMNIAVEPPEFLRRLLAVLLLTAMDDAPNFQTACLTWKAQDYELTIRKIDGKSPAQMLGELREENAALKARLGE